MDNKSNSKVADVSSSKEELETDKQEEKKNSSMLVMEQPQLDRYKDFNAAFDLLRQFLKLGINFIGLSMIFLVGIVFLE